MKQNLDLKNPLVIFIVVCLLGGFFLFTSFGKTLFMLMVFGYLGYQVVKALQKK